MTDEIRENFEQEYVKYRDVFPKEYGRPNPLYIEAWNAALDEAASRIGEITAFGKTTQDSFAVFIQGLKK